MMPINNIQFRAEIGLFNNTFQRNYCKSPFVRLCTPSGNNTLAISWLIMCVIIYIIRLVLFLAIFPFMLFIICVSKFSNVYNTCVYIFVCLRLLFRLLRLTIAYHKTLAKLLVRYFFFLQICLFVPFIRLSLLISGDIEINPGPQNHVVRTFPCAIGI